MPFGLLEAAAVASIAGTGFSIGSSLFGKGDEDTGIPEAQANQMNANFLSNTTNFTNYYSAVQSSSSTIPLILAYAGLNGKQIWDFQMQQQMNLYNQSYALGMEVNNYPPAQVAQNNTTAQIQANVAQLYQTPPSAYDNLVTLTKPFKDPFVFTKTEESPLYGFQKELGERAINRQLSARGLYGSGAGLETLERFYNQLGAEETERQYTKQQFEYGQTVNLNTLQRAQEQETFGRLLSTAQLNNQSTQFGQSLMAQSQNAQLQANTNIAGLSAQYGLLQNQFDYTKSTNAITNAQNAVLSGIGTYYNQQNADRNYQLNQQFVNSYSGQNAKPNSIYQQFQGYGGSDYPMVQ